MQQYLVWLAAIGSFTFLSGCSQDVEPLEKQLIRPVKLHVIEDPSQTLFRSFPGTVVASKAANLSFRMSGQLTEVNEIEGLEVIKGEIIARIDDSDAKNQLANRQAAFERAKSENRRIKALVTKGVMSPASYDQVKANLTAAQSLLSIARDNVGYTVLKSPFDGVIASVKVSNYKYVEARETIMSIENQDSIDISIEIPEQLMVNLADGNIPENYITEITFPSIPKKIFKASLKKWASEPTLGSQTYTVIVTMPRPKGVLVLQGMQAQLRVDLSLISAYKAAATRVVVPLSAIVYASDDAGNEAFLWRYDAGKVAKVAVALGELTGTGINILSGVDAGDEIVTAGQAYLQDGQKVNPWVKESGL
jgi:RND family efflux transporter MFP subunit